MTTQSFSKLAALLSVQPVKHASTGFTPENPWVTAAVGGGLGAGMGLLPSLIGKKKRGFRQNLMNMGLGGMTGFVGGALYNDTTGGQGASHAINNLRSGFISEPVSPYANAVTPNVVTSIAPTATGLAGRLTSAEGATGVVGKLPGAVGAVARLMNLGQLGVQGYHAIQNIRRVPSSSARNLQWLAGRADNLPEVGYDLGHGAN